ncbi:MORN repeat-containing protein 5 isoform X1 [Tyto alba]|uniref:MORN repeat-containing protein 5 isoform X1 n=1 Tax=Tyto alba TaxID=56313 RepID=UPI001C684B90|nr:MORN repeat-containing protein 5 isoform X1 [Tyto alba]
MEGTGGRYRGGTVRGRMEGQGCYTLPTGTEYRGALRDGMFDGEGELLFPNGGRYWAVWERGVPTQVPQAGGRLTLRGLSCRGGPARRPHCRGSVEVEYADFPAEPIFRPPRWHFAPKLVCEGGLLLRRGNTLLQMVSNTKIKNGVTVTATTEDFTQKSVLVLNQQTFFISQIWILPEKSQKDVTTVVMDSIILKPKLLLTTDSGF